MGGRGAATAYALLELGVLELEPSNQDAARALAHARSYGQ